MAFPGREREDQMSLILDALKKAKGLAAGKPAAAPPTALASFRFGRPSRADKRKSAAVFALLALVIVGSVGYTANFWMKRLRKPRAVLIQAPRQLLPPDPVVDAPAAPEAVNEAVTPAEKPTEQAATSETPHAPKSVAPAAAVSAVSQTAPRLVPDTVVTPRTVTSLPVSQAPRPNPTAPKPLPAPPIAEAPVATNVATQPSAAAPSAQPASSSGTGEVTPPSRDPFDLAVFYQKSGDYLKALDQYNKLLERDPLNASVYNNLGLIHYATNNPLEAIKAFRQATYIDPKYDKAHNNLGLALRQAGQDSEAQREFERALQLNPQNAEALTNLAALARKFGYIERAKVQYLQAIQANPSNAEAHYNLAMLYEEQGETGNAIDHFRKFLMLGSSSHPEVVADVEKRIEELSRKKE
jgi:Flp pilus assembly protein TadD